MTRDRTKRAFSLLELLVAIGIIGILIALLLPVLGAVRRSARAAGCLANLQQWGQAYQMYLNGNRGRSVGLGDMPARADKGSIPQMWWEMLQPYQPDLTQSLLCGEATEAANVTPRDAFQAWGPERFRDTPPQIRGPYVGSYGFNGWLYHVRATADAPAPPESIRLPTKDASRVPVIFDCARFDTIPKDTDPPYLYNTSGASGPPGAMRWAALERHKDGVNVVFLDGHAEHVPVPGLWKLKWSQGWREKDVSVQR